MQDTRIQFHAQPSETLHVVCPQYLVLEHSFPQIETPSLPIPTMATTNPLSVDWPVLDVSHQWNDILCDLLCLASLTEHHVFKVHPCLYFMAGKIVPSVWMDHICCLGISSWTFRMFHPLGFMLYKVLCGACFHFWVMYSRRGNCWIKVGILFNYLKNCCGVFHSNITILFFHQQCIRFQFFRILNNPYYQPF